MADKTTKRRTIPWGCRLDPEVARRVKVRAAESGETISELVARALVRELDQPRARVAK
jgi:predicted HicB family RNase H-like nuclease